MAGQGFIAIVSGRFKQLFATQVGGSGAYAGQIPATDAGGKLDVSFMPTGVAPEVVTMVASEALSSGNWVNIYNNAGTRNCRKADASNDYTKQAHGFVTAAVASSGTATVYLEGINSAVIPTDGTTAGDVFLSTAGACTLAAPTTAGYWNQLLGVYMPGSGVQFSHKVGCTL